VIAQLIKLIETFVESSVSVWWFELLVSRAMDIGNFTEILDSTFHWWSHNSSYATPGVYDLDIKDVTWCLSSALVFFTMKTGLALLEAGIVSRKNEINVMFKHMADICVAGLAYWIFGFALQYGRGEYTNPFFGFGDFIVDAKNNDPLGGQLLTFFFFQMSFATTSTTLVSGAIAERCRFSAYMLYSFLSTIVYSVGAGWIWGQHGFLKNLGALDFAGAAPIHITGGAAALVAVCYIGPRVGRYSNGTGALPMGNPMNVCLGLFILWFSWIAFNAGSSYGITAGRWDLAARAGVGTTLATMSAGTFSMWFSMLRHKGKVDILEVVSGVLASLGEFLDQNVNEDSERIAFQSQSMPAASSFQLTCQFSLVPLLPSLRSSRRLSLTNCKFHPLPCNHSLTVPLPDTLTMPLEQ